MNNVYIIGA